MLRSAREVFGLKCRTNDQDIWARKIAVVQLFYADYTVDGFSPAYPAGLASLGQSFEGSLCQNLIFN